MKKKTLLKIFLLFGAVILCILMPHLGPIWGQMRNALFNQNKTNEVGLQRKYLFCEILKPGMTEQEARESLVSIGLFNENFRSEPPDITFMSVMFTDSATEKKFGGGFILRFIDNRYEKAMYFEHSTDDSSPRTRDYECQTTP